MWKPESYRDTDYGLAEDESFEPVDFETDDQEPEADKPYIQTVLGRISPDDAGLTLVHEHLFTEPADIHAGLDDHRLNDRSAALTDLETFFTVQGRTVVDATIASGGRSARGLQWLAQRAPVHIVASSGVDLGHGSDSTSELEAMEREVREGLDGTQVRPGVLLIAVGDQFDPSRDGSVLSRIATISQRHGLPLMLDLPTDSSPAAYAAEVINAGMPADGLIAGNLGNGCDMAILREVAAFGTYLLFEGLGVDGSEQDEATAASVAELLQLGMQDRVLLSHGFKQRSRLTGYEGRPGLGYIVEQFAIMLLEAGVAAEDVRKMLVENTASALSTRPRSSESHSRGDEG